MADGWKSEWVRGGNASRYTMPDFVIGVWVCLMGCVDWCVVGYSQEEGFGDEKFFWLGFFGVGGDLGALGWDVGGMGEHG